MTTRPGNEALESLRFQHAKAICHLLLIVRSDGVEVACTDHDRQLTFEGRTYRPIIMGALSADRREGALRSGDQDAQGIVDEIQITSTDLDAQNFLGAEVRQVLVDWRKPDVVFARHRRWIRKITRTGATFTATLEGRTQQLQRPQAGRFGGFFTTKCQYRLGDRFCKKDISPWTQLNAAATSTASAVATSVGYDSVIDTTKAWTPNQFASTTTQQWWLTTTANGAVTTGAGQLRKIISNTATQAFLDSAWTTQPANTIGYRIGRGFIVTSVTRARYEFRIAGINGALADQWFRDGSVLFTTGPNIGRVFPIADYKANNRDITLLLPTPFDVTTAHYGIVQVGCDGLIGTCRDKFANVLNFGGDPYAPSAQQLIEPPEEQ